MVMGRGEIDRSSRHDDYGGKWGEERSIDLVNMMTMEENRDRSSEEEEGGSSSLVWL
jgi:hypothetical protein